MNIDYDLWIMLIWGVRGITQNNWTSVICYDSAVAISSNWEIWIENNMIHQLLWIFLIDFCVYNGKQYQQGQSWYDGCSYKCTCEDAEKGVYRCLSRSVSQSLWILVFWLLDCKKKILSLKFIIHKQTFCMCLKEGILFIFFLTLYHWGYDVSDRLSN